MQTDIKINEQNSKVFPNQRFLQECFHSCGKKEIFQGILRTLAKVIAVKENLLAKLQKYVSQKYFNLDQYE